MEVFSLMTILPFLLMFGLIAFNAVHGGPLQEKMKRGNKQKDVGTRNQKSVIVIPWKDCYAKYLAGRKPPDGLRGLFSPTKLICQGSPSESFYATMFDEDLGIPVYSAYTLRSDNIKFASKTPSRPAWGQTAGIKLQGNDELYPSLPFHRGHLAPAHTLSSNKEAFKSTFTYTNAVPQYTALNSGMWSQFERRIRNYAEKDCVGEQGGKDRILYILTGTLFVKWTELNYGEPQDPHKIPWLAVTDNYRYFPPAIAIPSSMWTAGCCVVNGAAVGNFAVFANNEESRDKAQTRQVNIDALQTIIKKDVKSGKYGEVHLFPALPGCEMDSKKVNLDKYKSKNAMEEGEK